MKVKVFTPERQLNLVLPLAHEATDTRTTDTSGSTPARSGAVTPLIGESLRQGDVTSKHRRSTRATTPSTRTSATATRTPTTRTGKAAAPGSSADSDTAPFTDQALVQAYLDCRAGKRNTASALHFEQALERNLWELRAELLAGTYTPGRSQCFVITRPKPREVWAAGFRDRIVHHLLYNQIAQRFHASFVAGSSACIPGRGTLYAATRLEHDVRSITQNWSRPAWYLKCDLANFFVSINKHVLFGLLARRIHEPWWLQLAHTLLFHDPRGDVEVRSTAERLALVPAHKSLFNAPADTGLPIGNLTSQFFANVLLDPMDQRIKHQLRCRRYVRYVDDFIQLGAEPDALNAALADLTRWLPQRLRLQINPRKTVLQPVARGIDCVGHCIQPWAHTTRRRIVRTALHRIEQLPADQVFATGNSYLGLAGQSPQSHTDQARIARALMKRGHAVDGDLSRIFRSYS